MKKIISHIKGKARCRKGIGMELALMVLLIVTACSLLMVSTALVARDGLLNRGERVTSRLALDQLAEYALATNSTERLGTIEEDDPRFSDYSVYEKDGGVWTGVFNDKNETFTDMESVTDNESAILIITDTKGNILLTVEATGGKITGWIYG